jgi:DNA-binding CsgD family transcriptional regulator
VQPVKALISFETFSEAIPLSVLALNRRGKYCFMNGRARRLISGHPDIALSADGSVQFADDLAQRQLETALYRILSPQGGAATAEIAVRLSANAGQFKVSVVPYPVTTPFPGHHFALDDSAHPAILLFIEEGQVQMKARVLQALRSRFELTPAEADLAWQLYSGMTLSTIAHARGISLHTARNHLRNVFGKTSTNKQHQVVRLVADLGREESLNF